MDAFIKNCVRAFSELPGLLRWSYLPPLMVYAAAGISGLTAIVGTFFIKDYLNLSAAFLAGLGFWAGLPWALKMPMGHLVDLIWKHKNYLVFLGAGIIALSLLIMVGLIGHTRSMAEVMPVETWYVISVILAPVGFVIQDVVADAMTVEAVPGYSPDGTPLPEDTIKDMHTTMQMLGRFAIIGGTVLVALANVILFRDVDALDEAQKIARVWVLIMICVVLLALIAKSILPLMLVGVGPAILGSWHLIMTGLLQHTGLADNVLDHRLNTRTVYMNFFSRFIYWNMNYHVEHHMFPMVPYHNLPRLHRLIKHDLPEPNHGFVDGLKEVFYALRRQLSDPEYRINRELPSTAKPYNHHLSDAV